MFNTAEITQRLVFAYSFSVLKKIIILVVDEISENKNGSVIQKHIQYQDDFNKKCVAIATLKHSYCNSNLLFQENDQNPLFIRPLSIGCVDYTSLLYLTTKCCIQLQLYINILSKIMSPCFSKLFKFPLSSQEYFFYLS